MDTKVSYTIVGIFVVVLGCLLFVLILWLTSMKHGEVYDIYLTYMREEVSGLSPQSPVRFNGVKVGYVGALALRKNDPQQVRIVLKIKQGTPITTSTVAVLMAEGITGIDYIGLKALTANAPMLLKKPGKKYPVIPSEPSLLLKMSTAIQEVTQSVNELSNDIRKVFSAKNREALTEVLANFSTITKSIADHSEQISKSIQSADKLLQNSAKVSKELPGMIKEVKSTLVSIKQAANNFSHATQVTRKTIQKTGVAVNSVSQQLVPSAEALLLRLNAAANNLQMLSNELQQNPSILLRGKTARPPGPGEK